MAIGLLLCETMSGTLTLTGDTPQPFAFSLRAFTTRIFSLTVPRPFRGQLRLGDLHLACQGELTIRLTGPHYRVAFEHPELGPLEASGHKTYGRGGLIRSLVTCPLTLYRQGQAIGHAEVAYREPILLFLFRALRLVREERAWHDAEALR